MVDETDDAPSNDSDGTSDSEGASDDNSKDTAAELEPGMVQCVKFGKPMEALPKPPLKCEVGETVFEHVSKEAWRMWLEHSKMLVNEYRLDLLSEHGQKVWFDELEKYFWGEGSQLPPDYRPTQGK